MYYSIRHKTRFRYDAPVRESVTEIRMQPRSEGNQRCLRFELTTQPRGPLSKYTDHNGNVVHYFDLPGHHAELTITAEALVEIIPGTDLPAALDSAAWQELDALDRGEYWDFLQPSHFARPTPLLQELAGQLKVQRHSDPLTVLRELNGALFDYFSYVPKSTHVDSPIDDALRTRNGVCQDFAHIMIALVRGLGIPCRYVSGYLFHRYEDHDRSEEDATHAWMEAFLPGLDWVGFDPTNNLIATTRHIRAAVGRDYADVPPTRGVYKGQAAHTLDVGVAVAPTDVPLPDAELLPITGWMPPDMIAHPDNSQQQQQQ